MEFMMTYSTHIIVRRIEIILIWIADSNCTSIRLTSMIYKTAARITYKNL